MFCWNCGTKLSDDASFCTECGAPAANASGIVLPGNDGTDLSTTTDATVLASRSENFDNAAEEQKENSDAASEMQTENPDETAEIQAENPDTIAPQNPDTEVDKPQPVPDSPEQDLILRKKQIILSEGILQIKGIYYLKKGRRFKKIKGDTEIPLSSVADASILRSHYGRKRVASFLLAVIFACGTLVSSGLGMKTYQALNTPYRQEQANQLENALEQLNHEDGTELQELELKLSEVNEKIALLEVLQTEYQNGQRQELMSQAARDLDLDLLFSTPFFQDAFEQYLTDLLSAFKNDQKLDEWLYPYYTYTLEVGENRYVNIDNNLDMWFYEMPGSTEKFSVDIEDGPAFLHNIYEFSLYDLIYYRGRIYLTASDLMNEVLMIPNYVVDGAVFVRAHGGNPDPAKMHVPGWSNILYSNFWSQAEEYFTYDYPLWTDYEMSAEDFDLDWSELVDEQAYYDAYVKFMDTIAPDLSVYNIVSYYASDDAYGGMGFDITGKEAAPTEIALLYLKSHPEALEDFDLNTSTSYDDRITDTQKQLDQLNLQAAELSGEMETLSDFLNSGDSLQADYEALMREIDDHNAALIGNFSLFCGIAALLLLMTIVNLCMFIRYAKKPGRLMILELKDGTVTAFNAGRCSKQKLEEFTNRCKAQNM